MLKMEQNDRVYYRLRTHLEMLKDRNRCLAYQRALELVVQDKVVLDVGCGSGILSFFAARAGAKRVLAVDMDILPGAEEVVGANGLSDRVQFFEGRLEDIELPVDSVDIIVSEWMGGLLLMEDMLPVVLYARDRWLKPGGLLLPDRARLYLVPLHDVAGISSKSFPTLREIVSTQMWVSVIDPSRFLAEPACILDLDLCTVEEAAVKSYEAIYAFALNEAGTLNGFGLWFDVSFGKTGPPVVLSTAPWLPPTHWAQVLWILPSDIEVKPANEVSGTFAQTRMAPSTASFSVTVDTGSKTGSHASISHTIEATPANMNPTGSSEDHITDQAVSGVYRGQNCFWIGCSMSMAALTAAKNGARSVAVLNHSPWATRAMKQFAAREGLTNVRFLTEVPPPEQLIDKDIHLLGAIDASWQALLSHIKVRKVLGRISFLLRFFRQESPWTTFYGFDFSAYGPYDLDMYHQDRPSIDGIVLNDITPAASTTSGPPEEEMLYRGKGMMDSRTYPGPPMGAYNCAEISFDCGAVVLPLPGPMCLDASKVQQLRFIELEISVPGKKVCRFKLKLSAPGWWFEHCYEQPVACMGHIVLNHF